MEVRHYEQTEIKVAEQGEAAEALVLTENGMHLTAFWSRLLCGCGLEERFDPIFVMENVIPCFDKSFNYRIIARSEWKWSLFQDALYNPMTNEILIRDDVYENALSGSTIDIITIAHEVVHCIQSIAMRFLRAMKCVEFKTELCKNDSAEMSHHELQTDKITSLVLSPKRLTAGKTDDELFQKYFINPLIQFVCGLIKMAGKSLMEALNDAEFMKPKEVERCAV